MCYVCGGTFKLVYYALRGGEGQSALRFWLIQVRPGHRFTGGRRAGAQNWPIRIESIINTEYHRSDDNLAVILLSGERRTSQTALSACRTTFKHVEAVAGVSDCLQKKLGLYRSKVKIKKNSPFVNCKWSNNRIWTKSQLIWLQVTYV